MEHVRKGGTAKGSGDILTVSEGGGRNGLSGNWVDKLTMRQGQVAITVELRIYISAHSLWKRETTAMFDIRIFNLDACSYLCMTPKKNFAKAEKDKKDLYLQACLDRKPSALWMEYPERGLSCTKDVGRTTQLQAEEGIL